MEDGQERRENHKNNKKTAERSEVRSRRRDFTSLKTQGRRRVVTVVRLRHPSILTERSVGIKCRLIRKTRRAAATDEV